MCIEADARHNVTEAIDICLDLDSFEAEQKRRGKLFYSGSEEFICLRNKLLIEVSQINAVANVFGQGRDDLDAEVLFAVDEVARKVSISQSRAVRALCDKVQKSFLALRKLFGERYASNIEIVDPQLRNNADLV